MKSAVQRISRLERVVLSGCAIMFLFSAYLSVFRDRDDGVLWICRLVVEILMFLVLTAALITPATNVSWDENSLVIARRDRLVLDGDWNALKVERKTRRGFQIKDENGRAARLLADRLPEDLVTHLEKTSAEQAEDKLSNPPPQRS